MADNKHLTKRIEEVEWVDTMSSHGWDADLQSGPSTIFSTGYVVNDTDSHITLAESICIVQPSSTYGCQTSIPKCAIVKRKVIRNRK